MLFSSDYSVKMPLGQAVMTAVVGIITVLLILALIDVLIMVVSKVARVIDSKLGKNKQPVSSAPSGADAPPQGTPLPETQSQGSLTLIGTDEKTAAVIMALVSYQSGIPLNRLSFKSIKLLEDENK